MLQPAELSPTPSKLSDFASKFSAEWSQLLAAGAVYNSADAMATFQLDEEAFTAMWNAVRLSINYTNT